MEKIEIICVESEAFYKLLDKVLQHIKNQETKRPDKWITGEEAMRLLRIKSKTTLQKLRDEGRIRFSQPERIVLYDADSIREYLEDFVYERFDLPEAKNRKA